MPWLGLLTGASALLLGPLLGFTATAIYLQRAFGQVASVEPSQKARLLAEGISEAMNFSAVGLALGVLGTVVILVSLIVLVRRSCHLPASRERRPPSASSKYSNG